MKKQYCTETDKLCIFYAGIIRFPHGAADFIKKEGESGDGRRAIAMVGFSFRKRKRNFWEGEWKNGMD